MHFMKRLFPNMLCSIALLLSCGDDNDSNDPSKKDKNPKGGNPNGGNPIIPDNNANDPSNYDNIPTLPARAFSHAKKDFGAIKESDSATGTINGYPKHTINETLKHFKLGRNKSSLTKKFIFMNAANGRTTMGWEEGGLAAVCTYLAKKVDGAT